MIEARGLTKHYGDKVAGLTELTARERQVLAEVGSGLSNAEIAGLLHISEATVKTHVGHIMTKLCLRDRIQAVVYAYETGLVTPQGRAIGPTPR
jgi:DNA-binding NarL/FixJ family response regulator